MLCMWSGWSSETRVSYIEASAGRSRQTPGTASRSSTKECTSPRPALSNIGISISSTRSRPITTSTLTSSQKQKQEPQATHAREEGEGARAATPTSPSFTSAVRASGASSTSSSGEYYFVRHKQHGRLASTVLYSSTANCSLRTTSPSCRSCTIPKSCNVRSTCCTSRSTGSTATTGKLGSVGSMDICRGSYAAATAASTSSSGATAAAAASGPISISLPAVCSTSCACTATSQSTAAGQCAECAVSPRYSASAGSRRPALVGVLFTYCLLRSIRLCVSSRGMAG